jgi:Glycosyl hydrolase family 26
MHRRLTILLFSLCCACSSRIVVIGHDEAADVGPAPVRGPLSGLPWPSGVHYGNELPMYLEWGDFRQRPVDLAALYSDRNSWEGLVDPAWQIDQFEDFGGQLVLSQPLYPLGQGNNADCAAGDYDARWAELGSFLVERGRADIVIRLGWGLNDPEHPWRTDSDSRDWVACFRRIVDALRSTAPALRIDWSFDPFPSSFPASGDPYDAYPGDDYVDIVGMDAFDRYPPTTNEAAWRDKCDSALGLCSLIAFARAHGKRFSVGEWGVVDCGESRGGDNAFYVRKMVETFRTHADILAYESYFDDVGAGVCSSLMNGDHPEAAAEYQRQYAPP